MSISEEVENCEGDHIQKPLNCDAETHWEDPPVSDNSYALNHNSV